MKNIMKKSLLIVTILGLGGSYLGPVHAETASAEKIQVKDWADQSHEFDGPVTEIVTLMPSDAEILYAIGAGDTIVGRGQYVDYPADFVEDIPSFATGEALNVEEIIALQPQLVLVTNMSLQEDQMKILEESGIPVFITDSQTIEDVYDNIELLGTIVGHEEEAADLVEEMQATFEEYTEKAAEQDAPGSVYYEISPLEFGLWTAGQGTFMDEIGNMLGLENIFGDIESWAEVSEEQVIALNPDYIVTTTAHYDLSAPSPIEEILGRQGWEDISAVQAENIYMADSDEFTRPGPRLAHAIEGLYNFVYGEE